MNLHWFCIAAVRVLLLSVPGGLFWGLGHPVHGAPQSASPDQVIEFNRDIRPLLSDRCFLCHGPDQSSPQAAETDLRLDDRESALAAGVIDLEHVDDSQILLRIGSDDESMRMPPPGSQKEALTPAEAALIRKWIQQGARYQRHWAYEPPVKQPLPRLPIDPQPGNPVDVLVRQQLLSHPELVPAPPADRETLIRRLSFDLTGLPPSLESLERYLDDPRPDTQATEALIDRLLTSPHYGEQMARYWLDAARYADTSGYQYDREREHWVWRDWVIDAFNRNQPFDEFTMDQMAGDLKPAATDQSRLATGFHRNHPITIEGGVVDEEYRTEYVIDRVVTTSTVWLGQTLLCARCHDHKYDPVTQPEFYQFFAFFNNVPERGLNGFDPKLKVASPLAAPRIEAAKQSVEVARQTLLALDRPWQQWTTDCRRQSEAWDVQRELQAKSTGGATADPLDDGSVLFGGANPPQDDYELSFSADEEVRVIRLEALTHPSLTAGSASRGSNGNFVLTEFQVVMSLPGQPDKQQPVPVEQATADYQQKGFGVEQAIDGELGQHGWAVDGNLKPENRTAVFVLSEAIPAGANVTLKLLQRYGMSHQIGRLRISTSNTPPLSADLVELLDAKAELSPEQTQRLRMALIRRNGDAAAQSIADQFQSALDALAAAEDFPQTMVLQEMETPRPAYVLQRGEYSRPLTEHPLQPSVPAAWGILPDDLPRNRLGLAKWLVSRQQPLTARVTVNRIWQQLFGVGLVKTSEDFGSQGAFPSHPELLDWLAVDFMENGWDVKRLVRTIVTSQTYQQASQLTPEGLQRDPENRLLARGPRMRLSAEAIRDQALAVSGLLEPTIGGPSVYPYHPEGLWLEINNRPNFSRAYPHSVDPHQNYRRSLYTFWKRTVPPPSLATFDAPSREYCIVRRSRTNTPLQALVLLHDPQFVEAARFLGRRMLEAAADDLPAQLEYGFRMCTSRRPTADELQVLRDVYQEQLARYQRDSSAARQLFSVGLQGGQPPADYAHWAAMTQVARVLFNLSEFLTKS